MMDWQERDDLPPMLQKWLKIMERAKRYERQKSKRPRKGILPFHIQHNITPTVVRIVVSEPQNLPRNLPFSASTWSRVKAFIHQIGVLGSDESLTCFGMQLANLLRYDPSLLSEAIHGHLYTLHLFNPEVRFSFAYSVICDWLWERRETVVDSRIVAELVGIVVEKGSEVYGIPPEEIAFSVNSVRGAFNWLKSLQPPVFERDPSGKVRLFRRRRQCSPLSVLWALSAWWQLKGVGVGEWVTWGSDLEEFLSRCLLLDDGCAKIAVEIAAGWQAWRSRFLEAQTQGQFLSALRLNRLFSWGESDF